MPSPSLAVCCISTVLACSGFCLCVIRLDVAGLKLITPADEPSFFSTLEAIHVSLLLCL